jgi:hypothetical protein
LRKFTFVHDIPFHHCTELKARGQKPVASRQPPRAKG